MLNFLEKIDQSIFMFFDQNKNPFVSLVLSPFSTISPTTCIVLFIIIFIFLIYKKYKRERLFLTIALCLGYLVAWSTKEIVMRTRPEINPSLYATDWSFPSMHATLSIIFFSLIWIFFKDKISKNQSTLLLLFSGVMILLTGFSRVYFGVHFTSDVIVGFLLGGIIVLVTNYIYTKNKN